jgi:tight adherence protein C
MSELPAGGSLLLFVSVICFGLSVALAAVYLQRVYSTTDDEDRMYMDPLPTKLKIVWPFIQMIARYFCAFLPYGLLDAVEQRLVQTGVSYLMTAEQYIALWILSVGSTPVLFYVLTNAMDAYRPIWLLVGLVMGALLPIMWLNDTRKRRELAVVRALPIYLDFITMCVEAGLNLAGAFGQALEKAPPGPLRNEISTVLRDLRAGLSRAEALRRMSDRLDISEVTGFISAVIQAERMGASLATVLRLQAEQRRDERFQRAEKQAMEAPIKLVGPLVLFIFPVTFIVLAFPIVMKFLSEGVL